MIKIVVNSEIEAKLASADGLMEICGTTGRTLGFFQPAVGGLKALSPFSDEEIERRRKNRTGRPLSDIMRDLKSA